jgi:hypothetical protein
MRGIPLELETLWKLKFFRHLPNSEIREMREGRVSEREKFAD